MIMEVVPLWESHPFSILHCNIDLHCPSQFHLLYRFTAIYIAVSRFAALRYTPAIRPG